MALLELRDLCIEYRLGDSTAQAVEGVSLQIAEGEFLGLVGESGCGKSTLAKAILGILPPNGRIARGEILYRGRDIAHLPLAEMNRLRWKEIAMVPQSAMNGFDPVYSVGRQIEEAIETHVQWDAERRRARIEEMFAMVGLERSRLADYPHQFSGGMRQRAMIAMAMVLDPQLVVADEPTTGLDVIVQDQILYRIGQIHREMNKTMLLITHDMAVVAENCDRIGVMYAGRLIEHGAHDVFERPFHPYTMGLCSAFPDLAERQRALVSIPGAPPALGAMPAGCRFAARCPFATDLCRAEEPELVAIGDGHRVACHHVAEAESFRRRARHEETWQSASAA